MPCHRKELLVFGLVLASLIGGFFWRSLFGGQILSSADVLYVEQCFPGKGDHYEPANRLLIDPVLQFQPWIAFNRSELRAGRLPLWNPYVGFGAPHLANGQSGVFDPVNLIAYLGSLPEAFAWMAAVRLWIAGCGMFLLAREWRLGTLGRWFAGLTFPFCGFLILWLQFPVTSSAIWLPWILRASSRLLRQPTPVRMAEVAIFTLLPFLGGHVQTAAHLLLATTLFVAFELFTKSTQNSSQRLKAATAWGMGTTLGVCLAAIQLVPLGVYLSKSPVWADRLAERERHSESLEPRWLDTVCTGFPYLYGSQRRGHPNVAKPLGVHNLNESAGGYAGLPSWLILLPIGTLGGSRNPRTWYLIVLLCLGFCLTFALPPLPGLLGHIPLLNVIDNRRTSLWIAFSLILLAAGGLDRLVHRPPGRVSVAICGLLATLALGAAFALVIERAHVRKFLETQADEQISIANPKTHAKTSRHVANALRFYPTYLAAISMELFVVASILQVYLRNRSTGKRAASLLLGVTLCDLLAFGYGMNPELSPEDAAPESPVIERLKAICPFPSRILAIDTELPPNTLMRYGLCDLRNYDSIELESTLLYCSPLFRGDTGMNRTSRREIGWNEILNSRELLAKTGVKVIVSRCKPPNCFAAGAEQLGQIWITRLDEEGLRFFHISPSEIRIDASSDPGDFSVPVTFDQGWRIIRADMDQSVVKTAAGFLGLKTPPGFSSITLRYDPLEIRVGTWITSISLVFWLGLFACEIQGRRSTSVRAWMPTFDGRS